MKLLVFGASGRTGREVVARALERRHEVTAFVRDPEKASFDGRVRLAQGDAREAGAVDAALAGQERAVSTIGPVALETTTEASEATNTIVEAMVRAGLRRLVISANATIFTNEEVTGDYANVATEHRRDAAILRRSSLDWTIVAPPFLKDDPATGSYDAVVDGKAPGKSITRGDFATALLDALERDDWTGHAVGVTN
jgi:uncharacterized protein